MATTRDLSALEAQLRDGTLLLDAGGHFGVAPGLRPLSEIHEDTRAFLRSKLRDAISYASLFSSYDALDLDPFPDLARSVDALRELQGQKAGGGFRAELFKSCYECGETVSFVERDGAVIAESACAHPGGVGAYSVFLNVPSGKIIFGNDFRRLVKLRTADDDHYVNVSAECMRLTRDYADAGMIHFIVGNSCPSVFQKPGETLTVENPPYDPDFDEDEDVADEPGYLGSIMTDLWWVSAMDSAHFDAACDAEGISPEDRGRMVEAVAEVEPGLYEFVIQERPRDDRDAHKGVRYAVAHRSGPCREVMIPFPEYGDTLLESHFWRCYLRSVERYPTLNPTPSHFLHDNFCVTGNGQGWTDGLITHEERDPRFASSLTDPKIRDFTGTDAMFRIPVLPKSSILNGREGSIYPMSARYVTAGEAPLHADLYWLGAALLLFRGLLDAPELLANRAESEHQRQKEITAQVFNLLMSIADEREAWTDLERVFAEFQDHLFPEAMPGKKLASR